MVGGWGLVIVTIFLCETWFCVNSWVNLNLCGLEHVVCHAIDCSAVRHQ